MYASTDGATYNFAQDVVQIEKIMEGAIDDQHFYFILGIFHLYMNRGFLFNLFSPITVNGCASQWGGMCD